MFFRLKESWTAMVLSRHEKFSFVQYAFFSESAGQLLVRVGSRFVQDWKKGGPALGM